MRIIFKYAPIIKKAKLIPMTNQKRVFNAIEEQEGRCNIVAVPPLLIHMLGDVKAAVFLSQLIYWSDKGKRRDNYIYKSSKEWNEEIGLSSSELTRVREIVAPFVEEKLIKAKGAPTLHYKLKIDALLKAINEFQEIRKINVSETLDSDLTESEQSITETTQRQSIETTLSAPLSVDEDWKKPDSKYCDDFNSNNIQERIMNICGIHEFAYGEKDDIRRIEQNICESLDHSGPDKHRFDPDFIDKMLQWGSKRARDEKPITVKMLLKAINNDNNYNNWLNSSIHYQRYKSLKKMDYGKSPYY